MERIKIRKLLQNIPSAVVKGSKDIGITGITSHSKQVAPGNLFIAKKGLTVDGARFIPDAVAAGASALLTDLYDPFFPEVTQIIHPNVAAAEAAIAKEFYGHPDAQLFLVGITGTNGKTTTSYLVHHLLGLKGKKCGLIGTIEWIVGQHLLPSSQTTPDLLQNYKLFHDMVAQGCKSCVMEVSSHALDQGRVESIEFDVAIFTNLTQDHLDYHGSMEEYSRAKAKLFTSLKANHKRCAKAAVVNADSPLCATMVAGCSTSLMRYGIEQECELRASHVALSPSGLSFDVTWNGKVCHFTSLLIGRHNVYNLLAATGVALLHGMSLSEIAAALKRFSQIPGRLERVINSRGLNIFVDYAHTHDALFNVLTTLRELKKGRLITVFGCGGNRDREKRPKMGAVAQSLSDLVVVTSDNPRNEDPEEIIGHILPGLEKPKEALVIVDRKRAIERAVQLATPDDIVLIAGKGHETTQIFSQQMIAFDDRAVALSACEHHPSGEFIV